MARLFLDRTMADRIVKVREQGKLTMRGLKPFDDGCMIEMDRDDILSVDVDWSHWLGGDTIASVQNVANTATVTDESNTTTVATLTLGGQSGRIEHRMTTAGGLRKELQIYVNAGTAFSVGFS